LGHGDLLSAGRIMTARWTARSMKAERLRLESVADSCSL
jgi:hypothetical protein